MLVRGERDDFVTIAAGLESQLATGARETRCADWGLGAAQEEGMLMLAGAVGTWLALQALGDSGVSPVLGVADFGTHCGHRGRLLIAFEVTRNLGPLGATNAGGIGDVGIRLLARLPPARFPSAARAHGLLFVPMAKRSEDRPKGSHERVDVYEKVKENEEGDTGNANRRCGPKTRSRSLLEAYRRKMLLPPHVGHQNDTLSCRGSPWSGTRHSKVAKGARECETLGNARKEGK
ncbi:hypothetical protein EDB84DRAFT_1443458 [Lactarius hengduanensis]|nr:hypothetical protein EDB84DRAFT_1443458 [Lactarius hengduanensis]